MIGSKEGMLGSHRGNGRFGVRRLALIAVGFSALSLAMTATPTSAQSFGPSWSGNMSFSGDCNMSTARGDVALDVMNPAAYANTGLYYYVRIWFKGDRDSLWTPLLDVQT